MARALIARASVASMRPGQTAPECRYDASVARQHDRGFNEAGADCPGMQVEIRVAKSKVAELQ